MTALPSLLSFALVLANVAAAQEPTQPVSGMYAAKILPQSDTCPATLPGTDKFYAQAGCVFACADGVERTATREVVWDPASDPSSERGDGQLWRTLTQGLSNLGRKGCLNAAAAACGDIKKISSFRSTGLRSGTWSMPAAVGCGAGQGLAPSPYDPGQVSGLRREPETGQAAEDASVSRLPELSSKGRLEKASAPLKDCAHPITASVCWGDCLCDPSLGIGCPSGGERWAQVLGTSKPPGSRTIRICGDALVADLKAAHLEGAARDVISSYCEEFAWRSIFSAHALGTSCSAYRGTVDCSGIAAE